MDGKILAKFVPSSRSGSSNWGPIFIGTVYLWPVDDRRKTNLKLESQRFFADELEPWVPV
jgi:hypothetical protein